MCRSQGLQIGLEARRASQHPVQCHRKKCGMIAPNSCSEPLRSRAVPCSSASSPVKTIRFDLSIDRETVATVDELRDHFTTKILDHFRDGTLARWLESRDLSTELDRVKALPTEGEPAPTLLALCKIFSVDASEFAVRAALAHGRLKHVEVRLADVPNVVLASGRRRSSTKRAPDTSSKAPRTLGDLIREQYAARQGRTERPPPAP